jgi:hypothetical protein
LHAAALTEAARRRLGALALEAEASGRSRLASALAGWAPVTLIPAEGRVAVSSVTVGGTNYTPTAGTVTLPAIAGPVGPQGPAGPAGSNGVAGAQAPAGSNGVAGAQGPPGSNANVRVVGGTRIMLNALYVVKALCEGRSYASARSIAARADTLLHKARGSNTSGYVLGCVREEPFKMIEVIEGTEYRWLGGIYRLWAQ